MQDASARAGVWCTGYRDVAARARSHACRCLPKGGPREPPLLGEEQALLRLDLPVCYQFPQAQAAMLALDIHCIRLCYLSLYH